MLLILFPYKFTSFYYELLEINILKKKLNTKIIIHDLSRIVNKSWSGSIKSKQYTGVKKFDNIQKWKSSFEELKKNKNLVIFSFLDINSFSSIILHYYLLKSKKKILKIFSPGVCAVSKKLNFNLYEVKNYLKKIIFEPIKSSFYIKKYFLNYLMRLLKFKQNIIFYSGRHKVNPFKNNEDKYVPFHSFDYSKYLNNYKIFKRTKTKKQLIFLDSAGPFLTDDLTLFGDRFLINKKDWYEELNNFLHKLEKFYRAKIIIIPHHKNKGINNPFYDKKFKVVHEYNAALKLIPQSKLVIANTATTAVSYAVVSRRPVLLIYNDQIYRNIKNRYIDLQFMSKKIGSHLINISKSNLNIKKNVEINYLKYRKYKYDYLTSKKIKNKMNYQIIKDLISK